MSSARGVPLLVLISTAWIGACGFAPDKAASVVQAQTAEGSWVGAWAVSPQGSGSTFGQQTLRQIVHPTLAGETVRVRLSNVFGAESVVLDDVHIAEQDTGSAVKLESDTVITFGGQSSVTIEAGAAVESDPVTFAVTAFTNVAVSFYLPQGASSATFHQQGTQDNYVAAGDVSGAASLNGAETRGSYYFLTNLDLDAPQAFGAVVTLGASITDGVVSPQNENKRWPNDLARRLADAGKPVAVLNQGISGNRLLQDGAGESAAHRFARDVVGQPGVRWVIFSDDPINDLGSGSPPSGDELIAAASQLIDAAHAEGIEFFCSTLTPFQGAGGWTPEGEQGRAAYNAFVRSPESGCDAVVDQDEATHDPAQPTWYLPAFDAGDHLHPNADGLQAIADAVDLELFTARASDGGAAGAPGAAGSSGTAGSAQSGGAGGSGGSGGSGGAIASANAVSMGGGPASGAAGSGGVGTVPAAAPSVTNSGDGCSCRFASRPGASWLPSAILLAVFVRRRRAARSEQVASKRG